MSDAIDPDARVWVATGFSGSNCEKCLHLDPECRNLTEARDVVAKRRRMYPADQRVCEICTGAYEPSTDTGRSEAYELLAAADPDEVSAE